MNDISNLYSSIGLKQKGFSFDDIRRLLDEINNKKDNRQEKVEKQ